MAVLPKKVAKQGLELFIGTLMDYMGENEKVMFLGFGRFEMKTTKERRGRVSLSGAECVILEHRVMKFYASETLPGRIKGLQGKIGTYGAGR